MIKFNLILSLVLIGCISSQITYSQEKSNYKCSYKFNMIVDSTTNEHFRKEVYIVQIGDGMTKGFTYQRFYNDSLKKADPKLHQKLSKVNTDKLMAFMLEGHPTKEIAEKFAANPFNHGNFRSVIYKDYSNNEIKVTDVISGFTSSISVVYNDELKPQDWQILNDTTTILGYHSQKAICHFRGRDFVAWFTTEIPISEGPYNFYGLPGLITKLHDTKHHYSFELVGFQKIEEPIEIDISKKLTEMERMEFLTIKYGKKKGQLSKAQWKKLEFEPTTPNTNKKSFISYDYIERDYK